MADAEIEEEYGPLLEEAIIERREAEGTPLLGDFVDINESLPWYKRPSLYFLLPGFVLTSIMTGGTISPRLSLFIDLVCREYYTANSTSPATPLDMEALQCNIPEISAKVARLTLTFNLVAGLLSAITSGKYGAMSDLRGRRFALMCAMMGTFCADIILIVGAKYIDVLGIYFFLIGPILDGLCGSFTTLMAASYAYTADCVPPSKRAVAFGYFQCCFYGGMALGPTICGYIVKKTNDPIRIFYLAAAVHLVFLLYSLFVLPESLSKARQKKAREIAARKAPPTSSWFARSLQFFNIFSVMSVFKQKDARPSIRRNLIYLLLIDLILLLNMGSFTVTILYTKYMFKWEDLQSGYYLSVVGFTRVFVLLLVLPIIVRFIRGKVTHAPHDHSIDHPPEGADIFDIWLIRAALILEVIGFTLMVFATSSNQFFIAGAISASAGIGAPTISSVFTKHVSSSQTGQLLGAISTLQALSRVFAPTLFGLLYSYTVGTTPTACFMVLAGSMAIGGIFTFWLRANTHV